MNTKHALKIYKDYTDKIKAYILVMETTSFDKMTIAPEKGSDYRNKMLSIINGELYELETAKEYVDAIAILVIILIDIIMGTYQENKANNTAEALEKLISVKTRVMRNGKEVERIQDFEGVVISRKGTGVSETFTVRKVISGIGAEKTFPVNSPNVAYIKVTKKGKVRRAKLYFLRERKSQYKIKEQR